jgi:diguanylate cyclase (GGDEF)-like protein
MQPLQETGRPSATTLDGTSTQEGSSPGLALGHALGLRAEECCDLCYARAATYTWAGRPPDPAYTERSRGVNWLATVMTARWVAYRVPVSADEMRYIAERGDLAASLQQSIVNITRAYLIWRDTIGEILREEAARLGTPREIVSDALRAVRMSCDASLVQMARAFDSRMDTLSMELATEREIDLDGFKAVNDSLGHDGGDIVLQHIADRLVSSVRESDTVARQGGDEFTVLLAGMAAGSAHDIAHKLEERLRQVLCFGGVCVSVGATVGVATYPSDGEDVHALLSAADRAMYRRKRERGSSAER